MGAFGAVIIVAYYPHGLPNQIFIAFQTFGLPGALPFALLLVVAALPLPVLAYLWSARTRAAWRGWRTMSTTVAQLLEVDLEVERRQVTVRAAFQLEAGERMAIFGTSGAGKTTILESIAGLTPLSQGLVRVDGKLVAAGSKARPHLNRAIDRSHSFDSRRLCSHTSPSSRTLPTARAGSPARSRVTELLDRLELSGLARARGAALSAGSDSASLSGVLLPAHFASCYWTSRSRLLMSRHTKPCACSPSKPPSRTTLRASSSPMTSPRLRHSVTSSP